MGKKKKKQAGLFSRRGELKKWEKKKKTAGLFSKWEAKKKICYIV